MYNNFGNKDLKLFNPTNIIEVIDSSSNIFIVKFEPKNSKGNVLGLYETSTNSLIQAMIKKISIPEIGFTDETYKRGGYYFHEAGEISIGECNLQTYNDLNSNVFSFWNKWYNTIIKGDLVNVSSFENFNNFSNAQKDNFRLFPDEYKINILIWKLFRKDNSKMQEILLQGCYPYNITYSELSWDNGEIPEININLKVDKIYFNTFGTDIIPFNKIVKGVIVQELVLNDVDISKYKNKKLNESGPKNWVKSEFEKFKISTKGRLESAGRLIISNVKARLKAEIIKRIPSDFAGFLNPDLLIQQIINKATTWISGKMMDVSSSFNAKFKEGKYNGIEWDPTKENPIDVELLIKEITNDWDNIIKGSKSNDILLERLKNWEPDKEISKQPKVKFKPLVRNSDETPEIDIENISSKKSYTSQKVYFSPTKNELNTEPKIEFNYLKNNLNTDPNIEFETIRKKLGEYPNIDLKVTDFVSNPKIVFNPFSVSYEELIIKSEKTVNKIKEGLSN
jgi:hypothetical protein